MRVRLQHGLLLFGIGIAAPLLASCDGASVTAACTTRPCPTGLAIELVGEIPENYLIRLPEHSASVFLQVDGPGFEIDREFVPEYDVTFANGVECGECRLGTIVVPID